ncbi:PepSY-associated TM helix domain-containing protein [Idiomarina aminovorans]|uniref:PepSY-associated TM helix domain-containing protein n=1 Tax=Idiomarina aminovorans TaxID=2914829 RepID=UPI002006752E|nr:PepSY-associated TM helix domain-containing protein [Idiomarina sp. ATCH4]MCK7459344.1 PepSY domain-containing protein [Idiomarina sp. ATCH4]
MSQSVLKKLHRWIGLALFMVLFLQCLTGSLLLFEDELEPIFLDVQVKHRSEDTTRLLSLDELAHRIVKQRGAEEVTRIYPPMSPNSPARVRVYSRHDPEDEIERFVDPSSGRVLGERPHKDIGLTRASIIPTIKGLHTKLLAGDIGEIVLGVVAILWLLCGALGIILSLPRRRSGWKWPRGWRITRLRSSYQLHRGGGLWLSGAAIVFSASAIILVFEDWLFIEPSVMPATQVGHSIGFDAAATAARSKLPAKGRDYQLESIRIESDESRYRADFRHNPDNGIWHRPEEQFYIDASNGDLLGRKGWLAENGLNHVKNLALPLHTGAMLGAPGRIAALIATMLLAVQIIAGIWLWLRKRVRQARRQY